MRRMALTAIAISAVLLLTGTSLSAGSVALAAPATPQFYDPEPYVAEVDHPRSYFDGCHLQASETVPKACTYAKVNGTKTIALFGDSHAAQWFGAVERDATARHWRMLSITKTHCPADDVAVAQYLSKLRYPECPIWRQQAMAAMRDNKWGHIDLLVMTGWQWHVAFTKATGVPIVAPNREKAFEDGAHRTLTALSPHVGQIIVLRDTPDMPVSKAVFNECMRTKAHRTIAGANTCGSVWRKTMSDAIWEAEKRAGSGLVNVTYVDLSKGLCPHKVCRTVIAGQRVYKDDNHMTQRFARSVMAPRLMPWLDAVMQRATPPTTLSIR